MRVTVRQRLDILRRTFPNIAPQYARHLYGEDPAELRRTGKAIAVWCIMESIDGRTSVHKTTFGSRGGVSLSVPAWSVEIMERVPPVLQNNVLPSVNDQTGTMWVIKTIVGWHFIKPPTKREKAQARSQRAAAAKTRGRK